jgi:lipopolysaccharide transport system ATP-binding protein
MSSNVAISLRNLSKAYQIYEKPSERFWQILLGEKRKHVRSFQALNNISLEIKRGEVVGVMGVNGSGKSTLLQLICGTLNPTSGIISVQGRISALLELGSGFNMEFTGKENVHLSAAIRGASSQEIAERYQEIIDFAQIGNFIDQPVKTYSSGMLVRLAFAVAINSDPDVLVIDEALTVGDELFQKKCFSRLEHLREQGITIFFVSHSGQQVVELCSRAILLDRGELLISGTPNEVYACYQKLIYSPVGTRTAVRQLILEGRTQLDSSGKREASSPHEFYEEGFDSKNIQNVINYEPNGAQIVSSAIQNLDGILVNQLERGTQYKYVYKVKFNEDAFSVRFGTLIKSISGLELGGALSHNLNNDVNERHIKKGSILVVEYQFNCTLNPGVYFLNAGVQGVDRNGQETYLHRIVHANAFRVLPTEKNIATALIDFGFELCIVESELQA